MKVKKILQMSVHYILLGSLVFFMGCSKKIDEPSSMVGSIRDQVYFSPLGAFSIDLTKPVIAETLEDSIVKEGSALVCNYKDTLGNHYSIMATYIIDKPRDDFLEKLVQKNNALGKKAMKVKTATGMDCYLESYLGKNSQERYVAKLEVVFPKNLILFDVIITGKTEKQPQKATLQTEAGLAQLWEQTIFRGRLPELPGAPTIKDPRIPITVYTAVRTAERLAYEVDIQRTGKQIVRVYTEGKYSQVVLSLGIQSVDHSVVVSDAISCIAKDEKFAEHIKELFFDAFLKELKKEKIKIKRTQVYDEDLLINPK